MDSERKPEDNDNESDSTVIKVFLSNKKEDYEQEFETTGNDARLQEVEGLIKSINDSKNEMIERRKKIVGHSMLYAEGKMIEMLREVFDNYVLGSYYSTIAVASMVAERLCYDFLNFVEIKIDNVILNEDQKEELYHLPFVKMVTLLSKVGTFDETAKKLLLQINDIRNRHIHPKMKNVEKDALDIVTLLCGLLESTLSMFRYYDLKDGKFVRKSENAEKN